MYLVGLTIFICFLIGSTFLSGSPAYYMDIPSLIIILTFSVPMLMASGLLPDFLRGFTIMGQKENTFSTIELKKTREAISLMIKLLLLSGIIGTMIGLLAIFINPGLKLWPNVAVSLITLVYSLLFAFILFPIKSRVNAILFTKD